MPGREAFAADHQAGNAQVVWTRLIGDLETPVSAMFKLAQAFKPAAATGAKGDAAAIGASSHAASDPRAMNFLLESVEGGDVRGRYSIIGLAPDLVWRCFGTRAEINVKPQTDPDAFVEDTAETLSSLRGLLARSRIATPEGLPPMVAGVFGYMGYDTVRLVEHLPDTPPDVLGVPDGVMMRPTLMVIFDAVKDEITVVTPVYPAALSAAENENFTTSDD
ncbi:MAG: hypothetical protein AAFR04_10055, partial [Pseudomonadota bacterium]